MEADPSDAYHVSSRLRIKACEIISKMGRPMAASEIEIWLRLHEKPLWKDVSSKCEDYVRIILSLTQKEKLLKFRPTKPIEGIDKRSTFFGLASEQYDQDQWRQFVPQSTHEKSLMKAFIVDEKPTKKVKSIPKKNKEKETKRHQQVTLLKQTPLINPQNNATSNDKPFDFTQINNIFDGIV